MVCSKCGSTNDNNAKFCINCGTQLVTGEVPITKNEVFMGENQQKNDFKFSKELKESAKESIKKTIVPTVTKALSGVVASAITKAFGSKK